MDINFIRHIKLNSTHKPMFDLKKFLLRILSFLGSIISYIPVTIYVYIYSNCYTKVTYRQIGERNKNKKGVKNLLDIGTATGGPLFTIVDYFPEARILGIDYNKHYLPVCQKLFKQHSNVEIKHMNFYDLERQEPNTTFDVIIFGSSFMLLPDQSKAIEIAKRKLNKGGRIYFLLTLYQSKTWVNRLMEYIKPYLHYISTVDFGKVTYKRDFESYLTEHGLVPTFSERCFGNFFLKLFKFYIYQVQAS